MRLAFLGANGHTTNYKKMILILNMTWSGIKRIEPNSGLMRMETTYLTLSADLYNINSYFT